MIQEGLSHEAGWTGVLEITELGGSGTFAGFVVGTATRVNVFLPHATKLDNIRRVTVFDFHSVKQGETWRLLAGPDSRFFLHSAFQAKEVLRIKEACAGLGAMGQGGLFLGFSLVSQCEQQQRTATVAQGISGLPVVCLDVGTDEAIIRMWDDAPGDCVFISGFSCQPYSKLGDQKGGEDSRSSALTGSLRAAFLLQASAIILECVEPASSDSFVQQSLREFAQGTGFHVSQTVLRLHEVWSARRTRWWAILTSPDVGPVPLTPWRPHGAWHAVEDVVDTFNVSSREAEQLELSRGEVAGFVAFRPMSDYLVRRNQPLPTALHSWGSPLSPCPCKCRPFPFSQDRLRKSGICSVVVPFLEEAERFRYPSPSEVALLNGLSPSLNFGDDSRLGLALVGQLASPLQSAWVFGALARTLAKQGVVFASSLDAVQILHTQRRLLLKDAEKEGFRPFTAGHTLSHCPAICFEHHHQILKRAGVCPSGLLPPAKKARQVVGVPAQQQPAAPQCPNATTALISPAHAAGLGVHGLDLPLSDGVVVALLQAQLAAKAPQEVHPNFPRVGFSPDVGPRVEVLSPPSCLGFRPSSPLGFPRGIEGAASIEVEALAVAGGGEGNSEVASHASLISASQPGHLFKGPAWPASTCEAEACAPGLTSSHRFSPLGFGSPLQFRPSPCPEHPGHTLEPQAPGPEEAPVQGTAPRRSEASGVTCEDVSYNSSAGQDESGGVAIHPPDRASRTPFCVGKDCFLLHALQANFGEVLPSYLVLDEAGRVVPLHEPVREGQCLTLWTPCLASSGAPDQLNPRSFAIEDALHLSARVLTASARRAALRIQGPFIPDDQMSSSLARIAATCHSVRFLEPLVLLHCLQAGDSEPLREYGASIMRRSTVISALPISGHWVTFAWSIPFVRLEAWDSCPIGRLDVEVSAVHRLWGKLLGLSVSAFQFCQGPARPQVPGLCGHFALADLWCHLRGLIPPGPEQALALSATFVAAFELQLRGDALCRAPLFYGAGTSDLVEFGLASLLRERGVPASRAAERSAQAVERLGKAQVQQAMGSRNAWKALKQLANNSTPAFQFVLQDELALSIQARADGPDPGPRKKKAPKQPVKTRAPELPSLPPVDQLCIPDGVFACEGSPLVQLDLQSIGQQSVGVILVQPAQAEPYLRLGQPVSQGALALVVVGDIDCEGATVQVEQVRFRAQLRATGEPLLVSGTLAQIGNKWVSKFIPKTTPVDVAESCVVRVSVYRDALPLPWDRFAASPLKEIVNIVPLLQSCDVAGCECHKWHGTTSPGEPPSILETWGRNFYSDAFKISAPSAACVFNIMLRLPIGLELPIQAYSGIAGVFLEPRSDGIRSPSSRFSVLWLPKSSHQDVLLLMQTHPSIVGLARVGGRFGVRCEKSSEEALHRVLRPATTWIDRSRLRVFESGPWPYGTQRSSITKALLSFGWRNARPSQPSPGRRGGLWFLIEAEDAPPMQSLHASFGEVLFSEISSKESIEPVPHAVVASKRTLQGLHPPVPSPVDRSSRDPLQVSDPWQAALDRSAPGRSSAPSSSGDIARVVEQSVLQRLKAAPSDASNSAQLEAAILAKVDQKISACHHGLDTRISSLDGKVGQLSQKVDAQENTLQSLFAEQMSRIEELLGSTKKGRTE